MVLSKKEEKKTDKPERQWWDDERDWGPTINLAHFLSLFLLVSLWVLEQ